ncbi:MAG: tetratricopeptide repeat protein [Motiliproteus sp.]
MSNPIRLAVAVVLFSLFSGCTSTQIRRAEPVEIELPQAQGQPRQFSPAIILRYQQAIAHLRKEEISHALLALQELLADDPEIAGAWYNLALIQHQQNDPDSALQSLQRCLSLNPRNPSAHTLHGLILRQQGQFTEARMAYARALESDPDFADAHLNLAILYDIYLQFFYDAHDHYQRYLELTTEGETPEKVKLWLQDLQLRMLQENN